MEIEKGLWFEYTNFVYGIKAPEEKFQQFMEERKLNPDDDKTYHEGQGPSLFMLHHDWDSLDGWWIGDEDDSKGVVIGTNIYHWMEDSNNSDFNPEQLSNALEEVKDYWSDFCQLNAIIEFLEIDENTKPTLHLITNRYFLPEKEIKQRYEEYPSLYPEYKDYLEADCWDIREIR